VFLKKGVSMKACARKGGTKGDCPRLSGGKKKTNRGEGELLPHVPSWHKVSLAKKKEKLKGVCEGGGGPVSKTICFQGRKTEKEHARGGGNEGLTGKV